LPNPFEWVGLVYDLDAPDTSRKCLARLYDGVDDLVWDDLVPQENPPTQAFFDAFQWDRQPSIQLLIGVLTILCHPRGMPGFDPFCKRVREYITLHHPDRDVDKLLQGFENGRP